MTFPIPKHPSLPGSADRACDLPRILSDVKIIDMTTLTRAIEVIHRRFHVPHIVLTSVSLDDNNDPSYAGKTLSVVGSSMASDRRPRAFKIRFPALDAYFSGTGDMFAALMVVRMRQAVHEAGGGLQETRSWLSPDGVDALDLPLARAAESVLATMHEVLAATVESMKVEVERAEAEVGADDAKRMHLARSKAAELKLVRHLGALRRPKATFKAQPM